MPKSVYLPRVGTVVARSYPDRVIGNQNRLPWRLKTDLQEFKRLTSGHAVIMGRRTFESLGKPLPNRRNIVLSRSPERDSDSVLWASTPETALLFADMYSLINRCKYIFVVGGEEIYNLFLRHCSDFWVTEVECGSLEGDAYFAHEFNADEFRTKSEVEFRKSDVDDYAFRISHFRRRRMDERKCDLSKFSDLGPERLRRFARIEGLESQLVLPLIEERAAEQPEDA